MMEVFKLIATTEYELQNVIICKMIDISESNVTKLSKLIEIFL